MTRRHRADPEDERVAALLRNVHGEWRDDRARCLAELRRALATTRRRANRVQLMQAEVLVLQVAGEPAAALAASERADRLAWRAKPKCFATRYPRISMEIAAGRAGAAGRLVVQALKRLPDRWHRLHVWAFVPDVYPALDARQRADVVALGAALVRAYGLPVPEPPTLEAIRALHREIAEEVRAFSGVALHTSHLRDAPGAADPDLVAYLVGFRSTARIVGHQRRVDELLRRLGAA